MTFFADLEIPHLAWVPRTDGGLDATHDHTHHFDDCVSGTTFRFFATIWNTEEGVPPWVTIDRAVVFRDGRCDRPDFPLFSFRASSVSNAKDEVARQIAMDCLP